MKHMTFLFVAMLFPFAATAQEPQQKFTWQDIENVINANDHLTLEGEFLRVSNKSDLPLSVTLLTIENPAITKNKYAIKGEVRYEDVAGQGYLEMWSTFTKGKFFTKTLLQSGPMQSIEGTSDWRLFMLPFDTLRSTERPTKLEINLVLPGQGVVWLKSVTLNQFATSGNPWWSERAAGLWGGILGSLFGCIGALIGVLGSKGKARGLVIAMINVMHVCGLISLCLGVVALVDSQPYGVYYPLFLFGVLCGPVLFAIRRTVKMRYEQIELHKMNARDVIA